MTTKTTEFTSGTRNTYTGTKLEKFTFQIGSPGIESRISSSSADCANHWTIELIKSLSYVHCYIVIFHIT